MGVNSNNHVSVSISAIGQDSHRFEPDGSTKPLILGGVAIPNCPGLEGNSDADVILHALTNAISGISGQNILGKISDDLCRAGQTDSRAYLEKAVETLKAGEWRLTHVSISIEAKRPHLAAHIPAIKKSIASMLSLQENDVGLTATTGEGLTAFGRGEGIQALVIASACPLGGEAYEFTWPGKRAAAAEARRPIRKTLRLCPEESKDYDTTENLYIEGDNLDVLKLLQERYLGKVRMIYIDPPYNTGNDFVYKDKWAAGRARRSDEIGEYEDETAGRLSRNAEIDGRLHSGWCGMIYPRLVLARELLSDDGVIFISIDDNEQANLKKICDEIFGSGNMVNNFLWLTGKGKKDTWSRTVQQYILCYAKAKRGLPPFLDTQAAAGSFSNPDGDPRGPWFSGSVSFSEERSNKKHPAYFSVTSPSGKVWTRQWQVADKDEMELLLKENRIYFGPAPQFDNVPRKKIFPFDENEIIPSNLLADLGTTLSANTECDRLFDAPLKANIFDNPKPVELIKHLIKILNAGGDITVMDFFSGSAAAAHAVMQLNAEDGGHRKFIMVQLPEPCAADSEAAKAGYKTICDIGKERIRRAGEKIVASLEPQAAKPDVGFRVLKLDKLDTQECC